jgi:hypothetical protein
MRPEKFTPWKLRTDERVGTALRAFAHPTLAAILEPTLFAALAMSAAILANEAS